MSSFLRHTALWILSIALVAVSALIDSTPARAQDCQMALESSTGAVAMANGATTSKSKGVDEWDGEVVKIMTNLPGVLVVEGAGDIAQSSVYTQGDSSSHPLIDSALLGTDLRDLRSVIPAGTHCIQVTPMVNATGDFEISASFIDACHLSDTDDHGDSFLCATPIDVDDTADGEIESSSTTDDYDMFTFVLESAATVSIEGTGGYVSGSLYDGAGTILESANTGGTSANFQLSRSLDPGRYYVQISGPDESSYELSVSLVP